MTEFPENEPFAGVSPIAPTPFTETGLLELARDLVWRFGSAAALARPSLALNPLA